MPTNQKRRFRNTRLSKAEAGAFLKTPDGQAWLARKIAAKDDQEKVHRQDADMREVLDGIYEAGGKVWDEIEDPEAYLKEMRGE